MLKSHMGKPHSQEKALERFISGLSPDDVTQLRRHIYQKLQAQSSSMQILFGQRTEHLPSGRSRLRVISRHFSMLDSRGSSRSPRQGKTILNSLPPDCTSSQTKSSK